MKKPPQHSWAWLLLGSVLLVASQTRFGVGALAWISAIPWLLYLRQRRGWLSASLFFTVCVVAWSAAFLKIITHPIPPLMAVGFGLPVGLLQGAAFFGGDSLRRRLGENCGTILFAAGVVASEWVLHALLPFGTWGSLANTQLDNLPLLQLASLTGLHGISFLMALTASLGARWAAGERRSVARPFGILSVTLAAALLFGHVRLQASVSSGGETRRVAAVGTDSVVGATPQLPDEARLRRNEEGLVRRTEAAAAGGAELVVWNEAATMVRPEDEQAFVQRVGAMAARLKIHLVAAYVVPISEAPLQYENKFKYIRPDGSVDHTYFKHEPVPGEPAVRGHGVAPVVADAGQRVSGAICYDYDFPRVGLSHAESSVDLVVLPSSDWRGIDPLHTQMAALRAVEGGHSILRSTRFGLSAGIDPYGRLRGWNSHFDGEHRVLIVELPKKGHSTLYGMLGDWFPVSCLVVLCGGMAFVCFRRLIVSRHDGNGSVGRLARRAGGL